MVPVSDLHYIEADSLNWVPDPTPKRKKCQAKAPRGTAKKVKTSRAARSANAEEDDESEEERAASNNTCGRGRTSQEIPPRLDRGRFSIEKYGKGTGHETGYDPAAAGPSKRPSASGSSSRGNTGVGTGIGAAIPTSRVPTQAEMLARMNEKMAVIQREKEAEDVRASEEIEARECAFRAAANTFWRMSEQIQNLVAAGRIQQAHAMYDIVCDELRKDYDLPPRQP